MRKLLVLWMLMGVTNKVALAEDADDTHWTPERVAREHNTEVRIFRWGGLAVGMTSLATGIVVHRDAVRHYRMLNETPMESFSGPEEWQRAYLRYKNLYWGRVFCWGFTVYGAFYATWGFSMKIKPIPQSTAELRLQPNGVAIDVRF